MAVAAKMQSELYRLCTFNNPNWKPAPGKPSSCLLARIGFYHVQTRDAVICVFCNTTIDCCQLECDSESLSKHCSGGHIRNVKLVDQCAVIRKFDSDPSLSRSAQPTTANLQMLKEINERIRQLQTAVTVRINSDYNNPNPIDLNNPDFDRLRNESVHLSTFESWPSIAHADPVELAEAGLFYTGVRDRVQCAFCRGFLSSWRTTDVPSVEHRSRFPRCAFACGYDSGNVSMTTTLQGARQSVFNVVMPENVHFQSHHPVNSRPSTSQELEWQQQRRRQHAMVLLPPVSVDLRDDSSISHRHAGNSLQPGAQAAAATTHYGVIASATVDQLSMTSQQAGDTGFDVSSELSALSVTSLPDSNTELQVYPMHMKDKDTALLLWQPSFEVQEHWHTGQPPFVMSLSSYNRLQPDVLQYKVILRFPNTQHQFVKLLVVCAEQREHIITVTARVESPGAPAVMSITPRHPDVRRYPLLMPDSSTREGTLFLFNDFVPPDVLLQRGAIIVIRVIFNPGHFNCAGDE